MSENMLEKSNRMLRKRKGTVAIILVNLLVFIALNLIPAIEENLLLNPEFSLVIDKPWTLFTVFFSHQLLLHFMVNMVLLFIFGLELEKITDSKSVVFLYISAGLIGSLAIVPASVIGKSDDLIAGASAAVFSLVAAFAVMRPDTSILKSKARLWAVALFIFNALTLISNPLMAQSTVAHIVGIFVGVLAGYWMKSIQYKKT